MDGKALCDRLYRSANDPVSAASYDSLSFPIGCQLHDSTMKPAYAYQEPTIPILNAISAVLEGATEQA